MAWLQNLAGRAEDLLNKIDQNAATVLNETTSKISESTENVKGRATPNITEYFQTDSEGVHPEEMVEVDKTSGVVSVDNSVKEEIICDKPSKSDRLSTSSSVHNSFILAEEQKQLLEKITKLEFENQDLNKQLLNMQHLYSQLRNENGNLQSQIERLNEQVATALNEKDQYIARAQRILQEKEKLISMKKEDASVEETEKVFAAYNDELKRELEFQQDKNAELLQKNQKLTTDIQSLQMQHQIIQNGLQQSNQTLEESLSVEKKLRKSTEDECQAKTKELCEKNQELMQVNNACQIKQQQIIQLKERIAKVKTVNHSDDLESRIKSLTQTLMLKQNNLETVTTERNALRLQIEKIEEEYKKTIAQLKRTQVKINIPESNEVNVHVPPFMRVTPLDAGVTRRVKHAYSTVDAISIRTGIFLRRYPLARVFVFCYMVLLHIWVFIILFLYAPSGSR